MRLVVRLLIAVPGAAALCLMGASCAPKRHGVTVCVNIAGVDDHENAEIRVDGEEVTPPQLHMWGDGSCRINDLPYGEYWVEAIGPQEHRILSVRVRPNRGDPMVPPTWTWPNVGGRATQGPLGILALFATGILWVFARLFRGVRPRAIFAQTLALVLAWLGLWSLFLYLLFEWLVL